MPRPTAPTRLPNFEWTCLALFAVGALLFSSALWAGRVETEATRAESSRRVERALHSADGALHREVVESSERSSVRGEEDDLGDEAGRLEV